MGLITQAAEVCAATSLRIAAVQQYALAAIRDSNAKCDGVISDLSKGGCYAKIVNHCFRVFWLPVRAYLSVGRLRRLLQSEMRYRGLAGARTDTSRMRAKVVRSECEKANRNN